jgi:CrcB protein
VLEVLLVGAGGVIGALLRYQITKWMSAKFPTSFPHATVLINVTGAFLLGLFTRMVGVWFPNAAMSVMLFLGTGLCGAYTTFSTLSYECVVLWRERRTISAVLYVLCTMVFGFAAAAIGLYGIPWTR